MTTNEPLRRLHPAVARPGRCAARVEFVPFGRDELAAWLAERGVPRDEAPREATLASLFARAEGKETETPNPVGFGA